MSGAGGDTGLAEQALWVRGRGDVVLIRGGGRLVVLFQGNQILWSCKVL